MLYLRHLMTQSVVSVNAFSLMGTGKSHTGLSLVDKVYMEARQCVFCQETLLPIGIDVLVRCHKSDISRRFVRTEAVYDE
ncbi:hypothetical protein TNCV_480031 [Trichonephila clavipes]|nr:hypothetical protein TNCV_480031 [Trichonephila clavipes]